MIWGSAPSATVIAAAAAAGGPSGAFTGSIAETLALSDAGAGTMAAAGGVAETLALSDAGAGTMAAAGAVAETLALSAAGAGTMAAAGGVAETLALSDAPAGAMAAAGAVAETAALSDAVNGVPSGAYTGSVAESLALSAAGAGTMAAAGGVAETLALSDASAGAMAAAGAVAETAALSDAVNGVPSGGAYVGSVAEALALGGVPAGAMAAAGALAEMLVLSDAGDGVPPAPVQPGQSPGYVGLQPADFAAAIGQRLLPRGLAWTRLATSVLQGFWGVVAAAVAAVHARAGDLTETESFPSTSVELLPDWEAVLGLPDPCLGPNPGITARQARVAARLAANGGQSIPYFEALATSLGTTIAVAEFAPFRAGINAAMQPLYTASWAYAWQVTLSGVSLVWFEAGVSVAGDPLWYVPGGAVSCEILQLKPAHTVVLFAAGEGVPVPGIFYADLSLTDSLAGVQ